MSGVPTDEAWSIVAGNAIRLFGFDVDKLSKTPAAGHAWRDVSPRAA
jgi:hypothetical protein